MARTCQVCYNRPATHVVVSVWAPDSFACTNCAREVAPEGGRGVTAVRIEEVKRHG